MTRPRRFGVAALRLALGITISGAAFGLVLWLIARHAPVPRVGQIEPFWALACVALSSLQIAVVALRWAFFSRELAARLPYRTALGAYYVSVFLNQLLPFGILGDAFRGVWHARRLGAGSLPAEPGRPVLDAATALVLDRASGQLTLLLIVVPLLPLWCGPLGDAVRAASSRVASPTAAGALLAAVVLGALLLYFVRSALRRIARARRVFFRPGALAVHLAYSSTAIFLHLLAFCCASRALGLGLPLALALRVVPLVLVASTLPSFAFGTGAREATSAALYHALGLDAAAGAEIALFLGLLGFVASLPAVFVLARGARATSLGA